MFWYISGKNNDGFRYFSALAPNTGFVLDLKFPYMPPMQATGKTMESYVHSHQDKSRNALSKALEASFLAWHEELRADQAQFESEKVLTLCGV